MAVCPYSKSSHGTHRLVNAGDGRCGRCGGEVPAIAAVYGAAATLFNAARACWDVGNLAGAETYLESALQLRRDFPEAIWLRAAIRARQGDLEQARSLLELAARLKAPVSLDWLNTQCTSEDRGNS